MEKKIRGTAIIADGVKEEKLLIWQKWTNTLCFAAAIINLLSRMARSESVLQAD